MKPKVALVKDGFLPPGSENVRGRLSLAAIERLKELAAAGWNIDGYTVSVTKAKVSVSKEPTGDFVADIPEESRSEFDWQAFAGSKEVGMRTCCNICRASLTYCRCERPRVWLDFNRESMVVFKPRKH